MEREGTDAVAARIRATSLSPAGQEGRLPGKTAQQLIHGFAQVRFIGRRAAKARSRMVCPPAIRGLNALTAAICLCAILLASCPPVSRAGAAPRQSTEAAVDRFSDRTVLSRSTPTDVAPADARSPSIARVIFSLAGVIALIVVLGWFCRRLFARQHADGAAIALVSRTLLTPKHQVLIVRVGRRLLVVGDSGHGMNLLCSVTETEEIESILGVPFEPERTLDEMLAETRGEPRDEAAADDVGFEEPPAQVAPAEVRSLLEHVRGLTTSNSSAPAKLKTKLR